MTDTPDEAPAPAFAVYNEVGELYSTGTVVAAIEDLPDGWRIDPIDPIAVEAFRLDGAASILAAEAAGVPHDDIVAWLDANAPSTDEPA